MNQYEDSRKLAYQGKIYQTKERVELGFTNSVNHVVQPEELRPYLYEHTIDLVVNRQVFEESTCGRIRLATIDEDMENELTLRN